MNPVGIELAVTVVVITVLASVVAAGVKRILS